jgi:hypothetical protein
MKRWMDHWLHIWMSEWSIHTAVFCRPSFHQLPGTETIIFLLSYGSTQVDLLASGLHAYDYHRTCNGLQKSTVGSLPLVMSRWTACWWRSQCRQRNDSIGAERVRDLAWAKLNDWRSRSVDLAHRFMPYVAGEPRTVRESRRLWMIEWLPSGLSICRRSIRTQCTSIASNEPR